MTIIIIMLQVVGMCCHSFAIVVPIFLATLVQAVGLRFMAGSA